MWAAPCSRLGPQVGWKQRKGKPGGAAGSEQVSTAAAVARRGQIWVLQPFSTDSDQRARERPGLQPHTVSLVLLF